jgi:hypothetical protein
MLLLVLLLFVISLPAYCTAETINAIQSGRWSSPEVWQRGQLPSTGDIAMIAEGLKISLDTNVMLTQLIISGNQTVLSCLRNEDLTSNSNNITLNLELLVVDKGACFSCGAGDCLENNRPEAYAGLLTIKLGSITPPDNADADLRTVLVKDGGMLSLNGRRRSTSIVRLAEHAWAGNASIMVSDPQVALPNTGWDIGELIAIAPTDYDPGQTEYRRITDISSQTLPDGAQTAALIRLDGPLSYSHNGKQLEFPAHRFVVDTRAEVALLSRNIVIQGVAGEQNGLGGDVRVAGDNSRVSIQWGEFRFLGRRGHLGRYPLHMHGVGNSPIIANVAVHESYQRGIVLHCTNDARVLDSVVAGVYGFAFMLEDGAEENNVLSGNLALDVNNAIPDGRNSVFTEHANPAGFWFVNPANSFIGNMAAGVRGVGFSWEMIENRTASYTLCPQRVPGYDVRLFESGKYRDLDLSIYASIMRKNFIAFRNNSAHSMLTGLWFRGFLNARVHHPEEQSTIDTFSAWKLRPRQGMPVGIAGANHDGCVHVADLVQLVFRRVACVNSANVYWSMESNVLNDTMIAWVDDTGTNFDLIPGLPSPDEASWHRNGGSLVIYSEPQTFLNTHVSGTRSFVFQGRGGGSMNSGNTIIAGYSADSNSSPLIMTFARAPHIFTDADGTLLGADPGARILSSCSGCGDQGDPIINAYAPNACKVFGSNTRNHDEFVSPNLSKGVIKGVGAPPLLCAGPSPPAFSMVRMQWTYSRGFLPTGLSEFHVYTAFGPTGPRFLRAFNAPSGSDQIRFFVPLTPTSMSTYGGYRIVSTTGWRGIQQVAVDIGPTTTPGDGVLIILSWFPATFDLPLGQQQLVSTARQITSTQCAESVAQACRVRQTKGLVCSCRSAEGDVLLRFASSSELIPTAYDSSGRNFMYRSPGIRLNGRTAEPKSAFDEVASYLNHASGNARL